MKSKLHVPPGKRLFPWVAALVISAAVWQALLQIVHASGALAIYVSMIVGLNVYAVVAAGIAQPLEDEDDGSFFLSP